VDGVDGYLRPDGRVGIRNHVLVMYTVECARHVATRAALSVPGTQVMGFAGCYADPYASRMMVEVGRHPNVAGVLLVSLGCESTDVDGLAAAIADGGPPVELLRIQEAGGSLKTIQRASDIVQAMQADLSPPVTVPLEPRHLVIGVECGGSDATSGLTANPATGWAVDRLVEEGAAVVFSEVPELLGCDDILARRSRTPEVAHQVADALARARRLGLALGSFAISSGNRDGGLTTIEEKSLGALAKSGSRPIDGVLKTAERPPGPGLYLLDKVGDVTGRTLTHYEENDSDGLVTLLAAGAQVILFTTGRGSVVGSVAAPVIKVCGNPLTYRRMSDDMDVNAGAVVTGQRSIADVGREIHDLVWATAGGRLTQAEELGHEEYWLPYKPGRACDTPTSA
jgi:altronate dehydratase large subunit